MKLQWYDVLLLVACFIMAIVTVAYITYDDNVMATLY